MDVKSAIQTGDPAALRQLLHADPALANQLLAWGDKPACRTHPLHFICDMIFKRTLARDAGVPLAEALIAAGADLDFQLDGKGDTPLIGAASLGAEDVGIALLDAGARPEIRGLFGETALHWAAIMGEDRLAARLVECLRRDPPSLASVLSLKDAEYQSTPLGWATHGRENPGNPADHGNHNQVIAVLTAAGAAP